MLQTTPSAHRPSDLSHLSFFSLPKCFLGLGILALSLQEIHKMRAQCGGFIQSFFFLLFFFLFFFFL
jgi:hypothetical protein